MLLYPDINVPEADQAPVGAPPALSVPATSNSGLFDVTWSVAADGAVYHLHRAPDQGASPTPPVGAAEVYSGPYGRYAESLTQPAGYRYWLNVCYAQNCTSVYSTAAVAVGVPAAPANFQLRPGSDGSDGRYTASWNAVDGASDYVLYQSSAAGTLGTVVADSSGLSYPLTLDDGTYYFQLRACAGTGCSPYVVFAGGVRVLIKPGAPALSVPVGSATGSYTVSWSGPGDSAHVKLFQLQETTAADFSSATTTTEQIGRAHV